MIFHTENSTYELDGDMLTRRPRFGTLRKDGEPIKVLNVVTAPQVGKPAAFILDVVRDRKTVTLRTTSTVVRID